MSYQYQLFAKQKANLLRHIYQELIKARTESEHKTVLPSTLESYKIIRDAIIRLKMDAGELDLSEHIQLEVMDINFQSARRLLKRSYTKEVRLEDDKYETFKNPLNMAVDAFSNYINAMSNQEKSGRVYFYMAENYLKIIILFLQTQTITPINKPLLLTLIENMNDYMSTAAK